MEMESIALRILVFPLIMSSANSSSTRLSRSTSDLSGVRRQRTPEVGVSSTRIDDSKGTSALPRAKIQALEQFVKFGRKGQQQQEKEKSNQKAVEFPPPSWFDSTSSSTTSLSPMVATADPARPTPTGNTTARAVPRRSASSQLPPPPPSASGSKPPEIPPNPSRHATAETGSGFARATSDVLDPPGTTQSPKHERRDSFPGQAAFDDKDSPPPEPLTLARRIQSLLSPQTAPQAPTPSVTDATTSSGAAKSETAAPATPGDSILGTAPITDSRFLALLGNTNAMSGSLEKGRQSVFAILDRLRRPSTHATEASPGSGPLSTSEEEQEEEADEGDSSVMLYGPIVPSEGSEVEIAASDIMSVFDDGETLEYEEPARPLSFFAAGEQFTPPTPPARSPEIPEQAIQQETLANPPQPVSQNESGATRWFDTLKGKVLDGGKLVSDKVTEGTKSLKDKAENRKVVKTKTRWVPSPDKISFQVTWWGYRLCVFRGTSMGKVVLTSYSCQLFASARAGYCEQQALGSGEARCYHNYCAAVVVQPCPSHSRTSSIPRWSLDCAAARALSWLELGCHENF